MGTPSENIVRLAKKSLKRVLGAKELFAVGYGDVGSSIYYTLGATALFALGATPLALFLAGIVFVCTALTFTEMSTTYPEPGGSATFSRHAFNDLISFIAGWGLLLDYIVTLAISAFTVMPYLSSVFSFLDLPFLNRADVHVVGTVILIAILFFINLFGIKHSGRFTFILAIFTFVTQAGIVILGGLFVLNLPFVIEHLKIGVAHASWSPDLWQFMKGTAIAMVAYTGIEAISQLAAETKQPSLMIPRAIKWTIVAILFLNIGISTVGLSVISPEELGTKYLENPVFGIAMHFPVGGAILGPWVGLIAAIVLLICANAGLIGCSRLTFSMGEYYQIPVSLFKIHSRFRTPYVSLAVFSILAALVVVLSRNQMMFLVDLYNFGAQIAFFSAHMALIILRFKKPSIHRPFKAPLNIPVGKGRSIPITAIFGALASAMVWFMVVITKPEGRVMGLSWMAIGIGIYFYYRKKKKIAAITQLKIEEIEIPEYKPMQIKHILVVTRASGGTEALQTAYEMARHHKSKITAVYILEVPHAIPVDAPLLEREKKGELALKRAEAIAREYHITPELEFVRSRSIEDAILHLIQTAEYDMVIIGTNKGEIKNRSHFALEASKLLHDAPCRVIFCKS